MKCIVCGENDVEESRKLYCGYSCYKQSKRMKEGRKIMRGDLSPSEYMEEVKLRDEEDRRNKFAEQRLDEYFEPHQDRKIRILYEVDWETGKMREVDVVQLAKWLCRTEYDRNQIRGNA